MDNDKTIEETKEEVTPVINDEELEKALDDFLSAATPEVVEDEEVAEEIVSEEEVIEKADKKDKPGDEEATRGGKDLTKGCKKAKFGEKEEVEEEKEEEGEEKMEKKKMKKSLEVEETEYEEFLAWKEKQSELTKSKEKEELVEDLRKALKDDGVDEKFEKVAVIMKSLNEKVERMAGLPARDRKSLENVQVIEKSEKVEEGEDLQKSEGEPKVEKLNKSKILSQLEKFCKADLIEVEDVTVFERTGKLTAKVAEVVSKMEKK